MSDPVRAEMTVLMTRIAEVNTRRQYEEVRKNEAEVETQKQQGRCSITPLPNVATQPFRSELTIERHQLFVVNSYKGDSFIHEREIKHPESSEPVIQRVMVGKVDKEGKAFGVLKQMHQELFYRLLKMWGEQGYPLEGPRGVVETTAYDLVISSRGDHAAKSYKRVRELLRELSGIPITLENAYTWQGVHDLREFSLIADVQWDVLKFDEQTLRPKQGGASKVKIAFSEVVTRGFLQKNIKQLLWQPYASLGKTGKGRRAEVARLLYPMLDYELSSKERFHISLMLLSERLGIKRWPYRSKRKEKILPVIRALEGQPILGEKYQLQIRLLNSSDGEDFIFEARRAPYQLKFKDV